MKNKSGFTLIELIVAISLLTVIVLIVNGTISLSKLSYYNAVEDSRTQGNIKRALEVISRDLREAKEGISATVCSDSDYNNPNNVCMSSVGGWSRLAFKVPESTNYGSTTTSYKTIRFDWQMADVTYPMMLRRTEIDSGGNASPTQIIAQNIWDVTFSTVDTPGKAIRYTITSGTISQSEMTFLRNGT